MVSSMDYHIYVDREFIFIQQKRFFNAGEDFRITEFLGQIEHPLSLRFLDQNVEDVVIESDLHTAYLDFDKLTFPLNLRKWKAGDKMAPFGMKGSKKVSDLLIDQKVPLHQKKEVWVMESNGTICWVVNIRSSEAFRITPQTKRVYQITSRQLK